jgi:hypothetical protein
MTTGPWLQSSERAACVRVKMEALGFSSETGWKPILD